MAVSGSQPGHSACPVSGLWLGNADGAGGGVSPDEDKLTFHCGHCKKTRCVM